MVNAMLRRPLSRSPFLRHFSASPSSWNQEIPKTTTPNNAERLLHINSTPNADIKPEDALPEGPLPTSSESKAPRTSERSGKRHLSSVELDLVKQRLRTWSEHAAIALRNKADDFTASTKTTFSQLGAELNRVTGYDEIEVLKRGIVEQENRINVTREAAKKAKQTFEEAVAQRSNSQREVNDLLSRKSTWADSDVGRFTTLVRQDHLYEQEEARAKAVVEEIEAAVEREFSQLLRAILARYHEEQVWSDKIRSASTYGSLAALGLNMLVFIMAILVVEPWKRRRLAQTFERKIEELSNENEARLDASMQSISQQLAQQALLMDTLKEEIARKKIEPPSRQVKEPVVQTPDSPVSVSILSWQISQRQLEVAAVGAGAFVVGIISSVVLGR